MLVYQKMFMGAAITGAKTIDDHTATSALRYFSTQILKIGLLREL